MSESIIDFRMGFKQEVEQIFEQLKSNDNE